MTKQNTIDNIYIVKVGQGFIKTHYYMSEEESMKDAQMNCELVGFIQRAEIFVDRDDAFRVAKYVNGEVIGFVRYNIPEGVKK